MVISDEEYARLCRIEVAYLEWQDQTAWFQPATKELGLHKGAAMRRRIETICQENAKLQGKLDSIRTLAGG